MQKKYLFFDIDGTLTDLRTGEIVPSAFECLQALKKTGHFVALNTGRAHYKAEPIRQKLQLDHMLSNGGQAIVVDGQLISHIPLPRSECLHLLDDLTAGEIGYLVAIDDSESVYSPNDLFIKQVGERREPTIYHIDTHFDYHQASCFHKIYIASTDFPLNDYPSLQGFVFGKPYMMIQPDHKKEGVIQMMSILQAPLSDVIVFGDDLNDVDVFDRKLWTCVAMGNACDTLKALATEVTASNVDDGILKYCLAHHLINQI